MNLLGLAAVPNPDDEPGLPWWVRIVVKWGPIACAFVYLLYFLTGTVDAKLQTIIETHQQQNTNSMMRYSEIIAIEKAMLWEMRTLCRHESKTEAARQECDDFKDMR